MNRTIYENTKMGIMSFLSGLIERAVDPYAQEIQGNFKLDNLRKKLESCLKETSLLINAWGYSEENPNKEMRIRDISTVCARRMCEEINKEVFALFRENSKEMFFMIDFMAFSTQIAEMLSNEFLSMDNRNKNLKN